MLKLSSKIGLSSPDPVLFEAIWPLTHLSLLTIIIIVSVDFTQNWSKPYLFWLHALWYLRVWSQRARVLKLGQVRVFSTHFEKNKGQKVKLKGHQYSFLAALRVFIRVASTHFWPKQGYLPLRYSQFKILVIQYIFVYLFDNFIFLSLSF